MSTSKSLMLVLVLAAGFMVGCSNDDGGSDDVAGGGDGGGGVTASTFTGLVDEVLASNGSLVQPVGINDRNITMDAQDDETAFRERLNP